MDSFSGAVEPKAGVVAGAEEAAQGTGDGSSAAAAAAENGEVLEPALTLPPNVLEAFFAHSGEHKVGAVAATGAAARANPAAAAASENGEVLEPILTRFGAIRTHFRVKLVPKQPMRLPRKTPRSQLCSRKMRGWSR